MFPDYKANFYKGALDKPQESVTLIHIELLLGSIQTSPGISITPLLDNELRHQSRAKTLYYAQMKGLAPR